MKFSTLALIATSVDAIRLSDDATGGFQTGFPFQLRSTLPGNRVMYIDSVPINSMENPVVYHPSQHLIKTRTATGSTEEWWRYDAKTSSIRSMSDSSLVLAFEDGLAAGKSAIARTWTGNEDQKLVFVKDENTSIQSVSKDLCLDIKGAKNADGTQVVAWTCGNTATNQQWYPQYSYQVQSQPWARLENQ